MVTRIGITDEYGKGIFYGIGFAVLFILVSGIFPGASILIPFLPAALSDVLQMMIILFLAPVLESITFPKLMMERLQEATGMSWKQANFWKSVAFMLFHFLAYGILLGALGTLTQLYGAIMAISGSLVAAFAYSMIDGYLAYKFKNLLINMVMHAVVNAWVLYKLLPFVIIT